MERSLSLRGTFRTSRFVGRLCLCAPLLACCLIPAVAQAQAVSAGDIAASPLPSMPAPAAAGAKPGPGGWGAGSFLPSIFDQFQLFGDASEIYSSNATGSSTNGVADYDTRLGLGINAATSTARINAQLAYLLNVDYFASESSAILLSNRLSANLEAEIVPDHVILQAQAYATPVNVSQLGNVAPDGFALPPGANGDIRSSYGYMVQPDFTFKLGHFLRSDLLPSYNAVYYAAEPGAPPPTLGIPLASSYHSMGVTERLSSGDLFNRLQWGANASYSQLGNSGSDLTQRSATGELSYAIDHGISLSMDAGYQALNAHTPFNSPVDGPTFLGGMKFDLAKLTGQFYVGEQYHTLSGTGHISYQITPKLTMTVDAQDNVNAPGAAGLLTPGALLAGLLSGIASGQIQVPPSGVLNYQDIQGALNLQNSIARIRSQNLSMQYGGDNYNFSVSVFNSLQDTLSPVPGGQNADLKYFGASLAAGHDFTPELHGSATLEYDVSTLQVGSSTSMVYGVRADYSLTPVTQLYLDVNYYDRDSNAVLAGVSPNSGGISSVLVELGIRQQFL